MTAIDQMLAANREYSSGREEINLPGAPARKVAILTCMDARMHPEKFLGLAMGDAHLIRNAGGRASEDAIRSLIISSWLLGTNEFAVIHHTECGMLQHTNDEIRQILRDHLEADPSHLDFLTFTDLEESVRDDVRQIRECPYLAWDPTFAVRGFIYDVRTGVLSEVKE